MGDMDDMSESHKQEHEQESTMREYPCKSCQVLYPSQELSYKMTLKMIYDTLRRIRARSSSSASFISLQLSKNRALLPLETMLKSKTRHLESSVLYHPWRVCSLCYMLYEKEQELHRASIRFSKALGMPVHRKDRNGPVTMELQQPLRINGLDGGYLKIPRQFTLCRLAFVFQALYDIPKTFYDAQCEAIEGRKSQTPSRVIKKDLFLRFEILGTTTIVPLSDHLIIESAAGETAQRL